MPVSFARRMHIKQAPLQMLQRLTREDGLSISGLTVGFAIALLLIFLRDPSLFTRAQFWAEDGNVFFAQAWSYGWAHSLILPYAGYMDTVQRLGADLALLVPLVRAPLVMMCWGLLIQALPVPIMLSSRCRQFATLPVRIAVALAYICYPSATEIHVVCTNAQWHLVIAEMLILFAAPPRGLAGKAFDVGVLAVASVSGPFSVLLLPLLAIYWFIRRYMWSLTQAAILATGCAAQFVALHLHPQSRLKPILSPSWKMFAQLVGGNAFLGSLLGPHAYGRMVPTAISLGMLLIGLGICSCAALTGSWEARLFSIGCFGLLAASLWKPSVAPPIPAWMVMLAQDSSRYWFAPGLALILAIFQCSAQKRFLAARITAIILIFAFCTGALRSWSIPRMPDLNFPHYVAVYDAATPGATVSIPINPQPWRMELVKR